MASTKAHKIDYGIPILLVESDSLDLSDMMDILRDLQFHNIRVARNGFEALGQDEESQFSLIFVSGSTEKVSASKVIAAIRAGKTNAQTPIVYTYRRKEKFCFEDALRAGANASLPKPSNVNEIRQVIERQLNGYVISRAEQRKRSEEMLGPMVSAVELGKEMVQAGEFAGAEEAFEGAILELFCGLIEVHLYKGNIQHTEFILERAGNLQLKVKERLESREHSFISRGNAYLRGEKFGQAKEEFRAAVALNPALLAARVGLGEALLGLGNRKEALEALERGMEACEGSGDTEAYGQLCALARRMSRYDLAHRAIDRAIEVDPNRSVSYYNKGLVFLAQKDFECALGSLNRAIAINPMFHEARITLRKIETWLAGSRRMGSRAAR